VTARTPRLLTAAERELLDAIRQVLDIPRPADYDQREGYEDTLKIRVYQLIGALETATLKDSPSSLAAVTKTARSFAAEPLRYEPESAQQRAEREARTQARLAEIRARREAGGAR
jgi:hypothetical protein